MQSTRCKTDESYTETDEIFPPVVEWPNILSEPNYRKIGDDQEIQPLRDDRLMEEIAKKPKKRINEKFQIAVPFRSTETHVPNNFQIAKRRLENQRKTIIKDEDRTN